MDLQLAGRVALVTGAASGIGRATALRLADEGARLMLADRSADALEAFAVTLTQSGAEALAVPTDVADTTSVTACVDGARERYGRIDVLAAIAGISGRASVADMSEAEWRRMLDVHLTGTFLCCRAILPLMLSQRAGAIVAVSSIYAFVGRAQMAHYSAAKAGIAGFVRALALEVADQGVRVNAVAPGFIRTPLTERHGEGAIAERARAIPMGRVGEPEEVADVIAFLAGHPSRFLTGQIISPNGGEVML